MSGETGQSLPGADGDIKLNGGGGGIHGKRGYSGHDFGSFRYSNKRRLTIRGFPIKER